MNRATAMVEAIAKIQVLLEILASWKLTTLQLVQARRKLRRYIKVIEPLEDYQIVLKEMLAITKTINERRKNEQSK